MLKLRQWTSKGSSADPASSTTASAGGKGDAAASSLSSPASEKGQATSLQSKTPSLDNASKTGSDDVSASGSIHSSQPAADHDEADPDTLLEREIEKRRTGNARLNGAVEALWSSLSKKKGLPYDMTNAQLAAVLAQLRSETEGEGSAGGITNGKKASGGLASALAELLPGSGGKDKEKPDSKMIPINALGIALTSYSEALSASVADDANLALPSASTTEALGTSLGLLGRAYIQIAQLQTAFASDIKSVLLTRLARSHVQLDAYAGARKRADAARSRLEAARSKAQKSKREKRELEDELRIASAAYDDAISELEMRAEAVLYTSEAEDLSALTDYLHSHLDFLHQSVECLERVKDNWAPVDDRALNRGINAGSLVTAMNSSTITERPRSRTASLLSNSNNTVRPRKAGSRPSTANSISGAVAAGAARFGFASGSQSRSDTVDTASQKSGKGVKQAKKEDGDGDTDSAASDEEEEEQLEDASGTKVKKQSSSGRHRRKSSSSTASRPGFNRSLSRLGIFGGKKEDASAAEVGNESVDADKRKAAGAEKDKAEERPAPASRGWSDTFKAKAWKREKDRDTGGFATFGGDDLPPGHHQQELDDEEKRRRADLLSGITIGVDVAPETAPRLPKRQEPPRRMNSGDSCERTGTSPHRGGPSPWATFSTRADADVDHDDFEEAARLGHAGRRDSSAATDIFRDGSGVGSPLGHSPYPSEGLGVAPVRMGLPTGEEARMLAFNNTGLSALSAGEDERPGGAAALPSAQTNVPSGFQSKRLSNPFGLPAHAQFLQVHQQNTGISVSGLTDPASHHSHEDADAEAAHEEERAVLTSNGASSQTQRYRSSGVLARMTSSGTTTAGAAPTTGVTGGRGAIPPPPVPSGSSFLKNRAPPPPPPSRGTK